MYGLENRLDGPPRNFGFYFYSKTKFDDDKRNLASMQKEIKVQVKCDASSLFISSGSSLSMISLISSGFLKTLTSFWSVTM